MLLFALLLVLGLSMVETQDFQNGSHNELAKSPNISERRWTYSLKCHDCWAINNFNCPNVRECPYDIRRCLIISIRLNSRELLIYKNCTLNCTFLYPSQVPPEAPRKLKINHFYFVRCCGSMTCNEGGITNYERDIESDESLEEDTEGAGQLECTFLLTLASILVSSMLMWEDLV
ncbi:glycosyl-phosphatidylinositol-anchored molecule-like protein [Erinaceus europaeus]|uniref:Glycosyl-phosphatidylinositol-anchored molecule-like protein n=1 Tax=Erinaceus europaeus TaxID=9365 RepID=A0A1S3WR27_ERIEU|nr:glycosyl-phosphatidylinositol-anchored molecule-like protein [Erinaceus europaeus]XP_060051676.1 glycosyl-phosphatidylinositol-anchored molecule-like protein [Erinaceus europaeus]